MLSIYGFISTPFEDIRQQNILGGLINPQGYCHVTSDGYIWDDEEMCVLLQDIWGNQLVKCCRQYTWLRSSKKDCPGSDTDVRYTTEILSDGTDSGPKRLHSDHYIPVIRGFEVSMNSDNTFTTRDVRNKYEGSAVGLGSCSYLGKPRVILQCDTGFGRDPSVILKTVKKASLRKGDTFTKKITVSTTKSVKNTESTTLSTVISLSNEQSNMIGVKGDIGEMSMNMKTVMSASTTISQSIGSEIIFTKIDVEEQTFAINCAYDNCHILVITSQDCTYQEISECSFIDPLDEFKDVKPKKGKIYYCETNERLINSDSENPTISLNDVKNKEVKPIIFDKPGLRYNVGNKNILV